MQARAIFEAAGAACSARASRSLPEIMIPLVGHVKELELQAAIVRRVAAEVFAQAEASRSPTSSAR